MAEKEAEEKLLRESLAAEARLLQAKYAADLALLQKQTEIAKKAEERLREERSREFSLRIRMTKEGAQKHTRQLDYEVQQKQIEFKNMLEKAKIEQETALNLCEIDNTRPEAVPVAQKNQYIPKLPNITDHDCLCTSLSRFPTACKRLGYHLNNGNRVSGTFLPVKS